MFYFLCVWGRRLVSGSELVGIIVQIHLEWSRIPALGLSNFVFFVCCLSLLLIRFVVLPCVFSCWYVWFSAFIFSIFIFLL